MITARRLKQATYAGGCFSFLAFFLVVAIFLIAQPSFEPTPTPTPASIYEAFAVERVDSVEHSDGVDIVAQIRNPNPRAGTGRYTVIFILYDKDGREILKHPETVYILPGSLQYVSALALRPSADVARIEVVIPAATDLIRLPEGQDLPTFSSFLRERATRVLGTSQIEEQKGIIRNTSTIDWERVEVAGVALDNTGKIVGIGKTFVGQLKSSEQREFVLQWPAPLTSTQRVIVVPTTNIYAEENILKVIGDPSLLR